MNGYTIKSESSDGIYYMVRNWRRNEAMWAEERDIKQEFLYRSAGHAIRALTQLLVLMPEYATDKLTVVIFEGNKISDVGELNVKEIDGDEWNMEFKVTKKQKNAIDDYFRNVIKKSWTWNRLTEEERQRFINNSDIEKISGSDKMKVEWFNSLYHAFLLGLGYYPVNWRENTDLLF